MPPQEIGWLINYGYLAIFIAMIIEGPAITILAAFAAALGYLDIWTVLALSIAGDLAADLFYYGLGYWGRKIIVERYSAWIGVGHEKIKRIEHYLKRHSVKGIIIGKFVPFIPALVLGIAGAIRMPLKKFLATVLAVLLPRSILFAVLGYYFGKAYASIVLLLDNIGSIILATTALLIASYYAYKKIRAWALARFEKNFNKEIGQ